MLRYPILAILAVVLMGLSVKLKAADEFQWLEEVEGAKPLGWVEAHNETSLAQITAYPGYDQLVANTLEILNSDARIPYVGRRGDYYYNFWQDESHVKGIYRRTTLEEYRKAEPAWETVLDIDALAEAENSNWVFKGTACLPPNYRHCLVSLSRGGADAAVRREFDMQRLAFVDAGFEVPEAKSDLTWVDEDHLLIGTDFGAGSLTDSGYPRTIKLWARGTPLAEAKTLYTAEPQSVAAGAFALRHGGRREFFIVDSPSFFTAHYFWYRDGELTRVPIPDDADITGLFNGDLYITLKSEWQGLAQGAVIYAALEAVAAGDATFKTLVAPGERSSIRAVNFTRSSILVSWLDNVKSRVERHTPNTETGQWRVTPLRFDSAGTASVSNTGVDHDDFFVGYESFLQPPSVYRVDENLQREALKSMPAMFDARNLKAEQFMATSKDGTQVPYFVVMGDDAELDGAKPTLLTAYGGFEISRLPYYSATVGKNWLARGGVYVLANIRGGGEFGPRWHQAALKKNRHKAFEDFEAVAQDLIERKITSSKHLGIQGGSNGGLLVGAAFTRRPELFNAVVCQVPLLDMQRYNKLLAGASWMGEYGNPDEPDMWQYIQTYSPYHNLDKEQSYPTVFFTTSTRDDRVHPGHARKMVAKMEAMGHDVLYFENTEGGHAGAADNLQRAKVLALTYAYLWERLSQ